MNTEPYTIDNCQPFTDAAKKHMLMLNFNDFRITHRRLLSAIVQAMNVAYRSGQSSSVSDESLIEAGDAMREALQLVLNKGGWNKETIDSVSTLQCAWDESKLDNLSNEADVIFKEIAPSPRIAITETQALKVLLRLMRSLDIEHRVFDFVDAAQNARDLLEKNGTPIRDNDGALIARAKAVELYPYKEAQRYGDGHPIGTFTLDVGLEMALFLEKHFSMVTENAPDEHDVDKIFNDPNGDGMSVSDGNESEYEFITLTCRDRLDARGQFTMMVGPDRLKDAVEALEKYRSENNIKTTT